MFHSTSTLMKSNYADYQDNLENLIKLLQEFNEEHWANYFQKSLELLYVGKPQKSIYHSLAAFGGMGSVTDSLTFTGANNQEVKLGFKLTASLFNECKLKRSFLKRIIEQ